MRLRCIKYQIKWEIGQSNFISSKKIGDISVDAS